MTRRLVTGATAWYDLARAVPETTGGDLGAPAEGFPRPARRPPYGVPGHDRRATAGLPPSPHRRVSPHAAPSSVVRPAGFAR
jgi:dTDP-4-dehydrorhamnose reductase